MLARGACERDERAGTGGGVAAPAPIELGLGGVGEGVVVVLWGDVVGEDLVEARGLLGNESVEAMEWKCRGDKDWEVTHLPSRRPKLLAGETMVSKGMLRSSMDAPLMVMCSRASGGTRAGKDFCQAATSSS